MPDMAKLVGRDEFVAAAKDGAATGLALRKAFPVEMKAFDAEARTIDFIISTASIDRMKDSIDVNGWEYDAYLKSPVVLWAHDSSAPPIAKAISVSKAKNALHSTAKFMTRDLSPFADSIFRMYQEKFLSAVSVGFIPISYNFSSENGREYGIDFKKQELIEYSCCPIPANPEALVEARAKGIDTAPIREWAERLLDDGSNVTIPRATLVEIFKASHTPHSVRDRYKHLLIEPKVDDPVTEEQPVVPETVVNENVDAGQGDGDKMKSGAEASGDTGAMSGNCGRSKDMECGMKDPAECSLHAPETKSAVPMVKAGRRLSAKTKAALLQAMSHHEAGVKCIKDVMDEDDGDEDDDDGGEPEKPKPTDISESLDPAAKRKAEAAALRASLNA